MRHRTVLMNALIAGVAPWPSSRAAEQRVVLVPRLRRGGPVHGGNLVFANTADAQSMDNTTVFDNNSIWIFEQIYPAALHGDARTARACVP